METALTVAVLAALAALAFAMAAQRQAASARTAYDDRQRETAARGASLSAELDETRQQLRAREAEREQLLRDYRDAQRLEAVGRLVGGVAHDFNNQLTSIIGYTELLLWDLRDEDPKRPDLLEVRRAADRANVITQQLLAFTRSQPRQQTSVNLADSVLGSIRLLKRVLGPDIQFTSEFDREPTVLHVDAGLLGHVLLNLGVRARERMPAGGTLAFEAAQTTLAEREAAMLQLQGAGRYATLTVRLAPNEAPPAGAYGAGPQPSTHLGAHAADHANSPLETVAQVTPGSDARGMAVVRQIMAISAGAVTLHPGAPDARGVATARGEAITLYLPCARERDDEAVIPAAPRGMETVLVVDDEPVVRDLTRTLLERHGYRVLTADRPSDALQRLRDTAGSIDLLVTDILLPEARGDQLAARLKAAGASVRVLYMSGNDVVSADLDGPLDPHGAFLLKPFTPDQLLIAVRQALDAPPPPIAPNARA